MFTGAAGCTVLGATRGAAIGFGRLLVISGAATTVLLVVEGRLGLWGRVGFGATVVRVASRTVGYASVTG